MPRALRYGAVFYLLLAGGAVADDYFADVTTLSGVTAAHNAEYFTTGQAWGDYDRDGCPDLYVTDTLGPNSLWSNECDGTFTLSTLNATVALPAARNGGAVFADYDNDGWLDLYVTADGANTLFHNEAGAGFTDVSAAAGVDDAGQGESAAWADYDGDGLLDLFIANYAEPDTLLHNEGGGAFTDVSSLISQPGAGKPAFACTFLDYDNDGDPDIYSVNDRLFGNSLWRNDGPGCGGWCFTDVSASSGALRPVYGMGIAVGDYDNDGDLDLYFSSIDEMVLLENQTMQGSPTFLDVTDAAGVNIPATAGWGTFFFDFDNDGWQDLYLATMPTAAPEWTNRLFRNLGGARGQVTFEDVSDVSGASAEGATLGVATGDFDVDGRVDMVIARYDDGYYLFHNETDAPSSLTVTLEGRGPMNRDAIGARVHLATVAGPAQVKELKTGSSLGAGNEVVLHFGLNDSPISSMSVVWPDGLVQVVDPPPAGPRVHLVYPSIFASGFETGDASDWGATVP